MHLIRCSFAGKEHQGRLAEVDAFARQEQAQSEQGGLERARLQLAAPDAVSKNKLQYRKPKNNKLSLSLTINLLNKIERLNLNTLKRRVPINADQHQVPMHTWQPLIE